MKFDWWIFGVCGSRTFTWLVAMTYSAALPVLQKEWEMSSAAAGSISSGFQLGLALSLVCLSELADRIGPKRIFLWSNTASALVSLAFALFARGYYSTLCLYTLMGAALGGTYTTAMMMIASRYPSQNRGRAVGFFIASTSLSYVLSMAISGIALPVGGYRLSFLLTCLGPVVGATLLWITIASSPDAISPRPKDKKFSAVVLQNKPGMLLIGAYVCHSWELFGMWTWTPAFLVACLLVGGFETWQAAGISAYIVGAFHFMGLLASLFMGALSDRLGRIFVILLLGGLSTACSFSMGWLIGLPLTVVIGVGMIYAFSAIGDSPVLSTGLTESIDASYMGAAFAFRSFVGFGAGAVSPVFFGIILDWTNPISPSTDSYTVWGWAYSMLGVFGFGVVLAAYLLYKRKNSGSGFITVSNAR
jgi:MFS family permease